MKINVWVVNTAQDSQGPQITISQDP